MVSEPQVNPMPYVEINAEMAKEIARASCQLAPIYAKIRKAASQGLYFITLNTIDLPENGWRRLEELGFKVVTGKGAIISWGP